MGCAHGNQGQNRLADRFVRRAGVVAEQIGDRSVHAYAMLLDGLYRVGHGACDAF